MLLELIDFLAAVLVPLGLVLKLICGASPLCSNFANCGGGLGFVCELRENSAH